MKYSGIDLQSTNSVAAVILVHYDGVEGRFTRLLPGAGAGSVALH